MKNSPQHTLPPTIVTDYVANDVKDLRVAGFGANGLGAAAATEASIYTGIDHTFPVKLPTGVTSATLSGYTLYCYAKANLTAATLYVLYLDGGVYAVRGSYDLYAAWPTNAGNHTFTPGLEVRNGDVLCVQSTSAAAHGLMYGLTAANAYASSLGKATAINVAGSAPADYTGTTRGISHHATISTAKRHWSVGTVALAGRYQLPVFDAVATDIAIRGVTVADGANMTFTFYGAAGNAADTAKLTVLLDCGATNLIKVNAAADIPINFTNGDKYDFLIRLDPVANTCNVFWKNVTTGQGSGSAADDITTQSAANALGAAFGASLAYTKHIMRVVVTGTAGGTVSKIETGRGTLFAGVSSWMASTNLPQTAYGIAAILDSANCPLTERRVVWVLGISGGHLVDNDGTGTLHSFRHRLGLADPFGTDDPTAGVHDGKDLGPGVWILEGGGVINDLTWNAGQAEVRKALTVLAQVIRELIVRGNSVIVTDCPPRNGETDNPNGSNTTMRKQFNKAVEGLCYATGATFVPIARRLTVAATLGSSDEDLLYESGASAGHLTTEGYTLVAAWIAAAYERAVGA